MRSSRIALAVTVVAVLCAVSATVTWLTMGGGEAAESGSCTGATYSLEAEREGETLEISFELQASQPGETWQIQVERAGDVLLDGPRETDEDGEIDVDVFAPRDSDGRFTASATNGEQTCSAAITTTG